MTVYIYIYIYIQCAAAETRRRKKIEDRKKETIRMKIQELIRR